MARCTFLDILTDDGPYRQSKTHYSGAGRGPGPLPLSLLLLLYLWMPCQSLATASRNRSIADILPHFDNLPWPPPGHIQQGGGVDDGVSLNGFDEEYVSVPAAGGSVARERGTATNPT